MNGCLTVFFDVAYQSYLPSVVERDQLVEGNSKLEITRSASQILGPGAAGILIGLLRAPFAMLLDSLSLPVVRDLRVLRSGGRSRRWSRTTRRSTGPSRPCATRSRPGSAT